MSILQKISEEIVPLSRKQNIVLLIIITCVFQFVLFYTPALADEAVNQAKAQSDSEEVLRNDSIIRESTIDQEAAKMTKPLVTDSTPELATSTPAMSTSTPESIKNQGTASSTPTAKVIRTSTHVITAYNSEVAQTDDDPCTTANGFNVCVHGKEDTIAANFLKFGTKVKIPELFGDRVFIVRDRMNKRHAERVDVWMKDRHDAIHFGVKVAKIQVVE